MRIILSLMFLFAGQELFAQGNWIENRKLFDIQPNEEQFPLYYLYRSVDYDFKYDDAGQYICDITYHNIIRTSNDDALSSFNRIYIPKGGKVIDILNIKSRAISKSGKTIELDQKDIKEIDDEESESGYRIFAVEGAEVGGEIEYLYTKRVKGSTFINEIIQFTSPVKRFEFSLQCPENLEFEFLTVNDTTQVVQIDTLDNLNKYSAIFNSIPEFVNEASSAGDANKKRIDFKLAYNSVGGKKRLNTFSAAGKTVFNNAHALSKEEQKALSSFIKEYDQKEWSGIERLKYLEHEAKKNLGLDNNAPSDLVFLLNNKLGDKKTFLKLIVGILNHLQIDYEIVVTSGRFKAKFEEFFDSWNYLDEYLIHLPSEQEFLAPHSMAMRYGYIPARVTATNGIFISNEEISDGYYFPVTRIDYIPERNYKHNMTDLDISVSFDASLLKNNVSVKRTMIKNDAFYLKSSFLWMDQKRKEKAIEQVVRYLATDADIKEIGVENEYLTFDKWNEPLVVVSNYQTETYIEQAGPSILFKIGELIGPQSEMYQEKERVYDVESLNNRGYHDDITVTIPEGYIVENAQDIVFDKSIYTNGVKVCGFKTSYELKGNQLKVTLDEFYDQLVFPVSRFDEYRSVVNAAADWNKVVLVLRKV